MRLAIILTFLAGQAAAHPGHLVDVAGHDHWIAGAILGAAVIAGLWGALKGGKDEDAEDAAQPEEEAAA